MDPIVKEYPATADAIRAARAFIAETFGDHPDAYDARLLVTELATNAVRYGSGTHFTVTIEGRRVTVANAGDAPLPNPNPAPYADLDAESGRGLGFLTDFARAWGTAFEDHVVKVWFDLTTSHPFPTA